MCVLAIPYRVNARTIIILRGEAEKYSLIMAEWKWYVYIIECMDGLYYTGMTYNVDERMEEHATGKGSAFTGRHGFKRLCHKEEFADIIEARQREHQLKDFSRKKKEALWKK